METTKNETTTTTTAPETAAERGAKAYAAIRAELEALGHEVAEGFVVDRVWTSFRISEDRRPGSYRQAGTGRLRAVFGGCGDSRQFPEPKKGFDAKRIAAEISSFVSAKILATKKENERRNAIDANRAVAAEVNAAVGSSPLTNARAEASGFGELIVQVGFVRVANADEAKAIIEGFRKVVAAAKGIDR